MLALTLLVVAGMNLASPGQSLLDALEFAIMPEWSFLISLLPFLLIVGVLGPVLSLLALGWFVHLMRRRRGRARLVDPEPRAITFDAAGAAVIPANEPYCLRDGLIYPAGTTRCDECKDELLVRCPVDSTVRPAGQQLCRGCGTKYVLGARSAAVRRSPGPPEGGAAVA